MLFRSEISVDGKAIPTGSLSSYAMAQEIAALLRDEIARGEFLLNPPMQPLPVDKSFRPLTVKEKSR